MIFTSSVVGWPACARSPITAIAWPTTQRSISHSRPCSSAICRKLSGGTISPAPRIQPDVGLVGRAGFALQADHRLVVQQEAVVVQRVAQARDPGLDAFFLGAVDRAGIEDLDAVAADADRRLHAVVGLGQDLR